MKKIICLVSLVLTTIPLSLYALFVSLFDREGVHVHQIARFWARTHLRVCGITVHIRGSEKLNNPPYTFMCNHQSALDIYSLFAAMPLPFKWIAKRELFHIPIIGWAMHRAGYISLDRKNPREALKAIEKAARKIKEGASVVIFPEGTRSKDGNLLPFKKGGFSLAVRAMVPIVPVGISGTARLQPKGSFIPGKTGDVYIDIGEPIVVEGEHPSAKTRIMADIRGHIERLMACHKNAIKHSDVERSGLIRK